LLNYTRIQGSKKTFSFVIKEAGASQQCISETPPCVPKNGRRALSVSPYIFPHVLRRSTQAHKGEILPNLFCHRDVLKTPLYNIKIAKENFTTALLQLRKYRNISLLL
jgi:hypothetical protein